MSTSQENRTGDSAVGGSGGAVSGWPRGTSWIERKIGNGPTRILVAVIAIPILLVVFRTGGPAFVLLLGLISLGASWELSQMFDRVGARPYRGTLFPTIVLLFALTAGGLYTDLLSERSRGLLLTLLLLFVVSTLLLALRSSRQEAIRRLPATGLAFLYTGVLPATLAILYEAINHYLHLVATPTPGVDYLVPIRNESFEFILMIFGSIWLCDTGAYVVGRAIGRRKLAPEISPNKSVAGAVGGLLFSIATALLIGLLFVDGLPLIDIVIIGTLVGTVGQLGDLVESHLKRATGVKDSSAIIPGHGGLLDRFDSLFLVAPTVLAYLNLRAFFIDILQV